MKFINKSIDYIENTMVKNLSQHTLYLYIVSFIIIALSSYFTLMHFPNSADEYAYLFQSETFSSGHLWNNTHPLQEFFNYIHIWAHDGKWVSRFPPGYPIILTISDLLKIPSWLANPILSTLTLWIFFVFTNKIHGIKVASIATLTLLCSSFFIINGASYFSHMAALLLILLFYYFSVLFIETARWKYAFTAGIWIGFAFLTRPYSAVLTAIPLLIFFAYKQPKRTIIGAIFVLLGALPFLVFLLYYNNAITGNPFMMVTQWLDPQEGIGFIKGHTWLRAGYYTVRHMLDLMFWTSPFILILLGNVFFINKIKTKSSWIILEIIIFFTVVIGYALYYTYGGNQYGPRFYFEGFPFVVMAVTAMLFGIDVQPNPRIYISKILYIVGFLISLTFIPYHSWKEHKVIKERTNLYTLVKSQKINDAIVLVSKRTGVIRPMSIGDLIRNGITVDNKDIIYARDLGQKSYAKLYKYFPDKKIYRYERESNSPSGRLIKLNIRN